MYMTSPLAFVHEVGQVLDRGIPQTSPQGVSRRRAPRAEGGRMLACKGSLLLMFLIISCVLLLTSSSSSSCSSSYFFFLVLLLLLACLAEVPVPRRTRRTKLADVTEVPRQVPRFRRAVARGLPRGVPWDSTPRPEDQAPVSRARCPSFAA